MPTSLRRVTSYLITNITVTFFWIFFFVLNRTTILGREHVGEARNTLLLSHHQSMIDSFLVGISAYYPMSWIKPYLQPWNPAAVENFYKNPIMAWLSDSWKCIPVREGRQDMAALKRMIRVLPRGVMILFPQGSRSRDGSVRSGRPGAGLVILSTRPRVIPVAIDGMDKVLPIGKFIPRVFKRIYVSFGPPLDYSEFLDQPHSKETAEALVNRVMDAVRTQHLELRRIQGIHPA